ncbi:MAG: TonB-dependent receptor [Sphingomonadaceae bacterium]|nr:TonB-dependent receptor [Sphingomonadaceae bacterium]
MIHDKSGSRLVRISMTAGTLITALTASVVMPTPLLAQEAEAEQPEILVTARRREETLISTPVVANVLTQEDIARYDSVSIAQIANTVPSLIVGEVSTQTGGVLVLRGVGSGPDNPSTDQAVALNIDGVQVSKALALKLGRLDVAQVEVLRGPQALFFGKNSPGGVISLNSAEPTNELYTMLQGSYEFNDQQTQLTGVVSTPLSGTAGIRVAGYYSKMTDGYVKNVAGSNPRRKEGPNSEEFFIRGGLKFEAGDTLTARVKLSYGKLENAGISSVQQLFYCTFGVPQYELASLSAAGTDDCTGNGTTVRGELSPAQAAAAPGFRDGTPYYESRQFLASGQLDYNINDQMTLTSVTGYYNLHQQIADTYTFTEIPVLAAHSNLRVNQFSQELRLASDFDGPVNFLLGGFYESNRHRDFIPLIITLPSVFVPPIGAHDIKGDAFSLFGQLRWNLNEQIELSGGARYSDESKKLKSTNNGVTVNYVTPTKISDDNLSPEVTLTWRPNDSTTAFVSYKQGFKSGGFSSTSGGLGGIAPTADFSYEPEKVKGFEGGIKLAAMDRQLRLNLSAYSYDYTNLQQSSFDSTAITLVVRNAAGAKVDGVEFDGTFRPSGVSGLSLRGSLAYNDARYTDFITGCFGGQTIAQGCNGVDSTGTPTQNLGGRRMVNAPKWSANLGFDFAQEVSSGLEASLSFDSTYRSSYMPFQNYNPNAQQKGSWNLDAALRLRAEKGWELALIGRNLTDTLRVASGNDVPSTGGGTGTVAGFSSDLFGAFNRPRTIMLQITLRPQDF